jgi:hypothetical protein
MNDLDNVPGPSSKSCEEIPQPSTSSNYLIPSGYHEEREVLPQKSETVLQLELLKRIRRLKVKDEENGTNVYHHIGFKVVRISCFKGCLLIVLFPVRLLQ